MHLSQPWFYILSTFFLGPARHYAESFTFSGKLLCSHIPAYFKYVVSGKWGLNTHVFRGGTFEKYCPPPSNSFTHSSQEIEDSSNNCINSKRRLLSKEDCRKEWYGSVGLSGLWLQREWSSSHPIPSPHHQIELLAFTVSDSYFLPSILLSKLRYL